MSTHLSAEAIDNLARKRAGAKLGWLIHAGVYAIVNIFLMLAALYQGKVWAFFPIMGWGLGLAIHGAAVWFASSGSALHNKLLARERARLIAQSDPW